jgi:hypothetical protein
MNYILFSTKQELSERLTATTNGLELKNLQPHINLVCQNLKDLVPLPFLVSLINAHQAQSLNSFETELYEYYRNCVAHFALAQALPSLAVQVSATGIHRRESEKEQTAYSGQYQALMDSLKSTGYQYLDKLCGLLLSSSSGQEPEILTKLFVRQVKDLNQFVSIEYSAVLFYKNLDTFYRIERQYLQKLLDSQYEVLLLSNQHSLANTPENALIESILWQIKGYVVSTFMLEKLRCASIHYTPNGFYRHSFQGEQAQQTAVPINNHQLNMLLQQFENQQSNYGNQIIKTLKELLPPKITYTKPLNNENNKVIIF